MSVPATDAEAPVDDRLHRVCSTDELPPGERVFTTVRGVSIAVFNRNGTYYALHNRCPHQGAPLCIGELSGVFEARGPGFDFKWSRQDEFVRCPWHGWEFELASGRNLTDPRVRTKTYAVREQDGEIYLELAR